ncbi:MAG TPA: hypothetical protein VMP11_14455 [Verrucomicrobiae bacterium]|nr:hypothetical protein [Verrucomicrobiae bacterium]
MITLVDLIQLIFAFLGLGFGMIAGQKGGVLGAITGAIVGFVIGVYLGSLPKRATIRRERRKFSQLTVGQLREGLYDSKCMTPNYFLMELKSRGENVQEHFALVVRMMESDSFLRRQFGYAALLSAFPDQARKLRHYRPAESPEVCREKVSVLRG